MVLHVIMSNNLAKTINLPNVADSVTEGKIEKLTRSINFNK
jgi:hypothetical protein